MDILFFNTYYSQKQEYYSFYKPNPPMGLLYLSAYLDKNHIGSKVYELGVFKEEDAILDGDRIRFGLSDAEIRLIIRDEKPLVIGLNCMYSIYYNDVANIARVIKEEDQNIKVVVGGNHASSYWKEIMKDENIDYVVIGEGEETFLELIDGIYQGCDGEDVDGIAYRDNGIVVRTKPRVLIKDLDDIPMPAYEKIDFEKYIEEGNVFCMRLSSQGIISSRGCPNNCIYCTVKAVWGRKWRGRSPKKVVDEIQYLKNAYQIKEFAFLDDSMSINKERLVGICDEIIRRDLNIKWTTPNGIAHWTLNKEILKKMKDAGCYRITFGIESGNQGTRRFIRKSYPLDQAKELIKHANRIGMWTICTNIIGFPCEDINDMNDTYKFAVDCGTDFACFYLLIPQPTSDVYKYYDESLIDEESLNETGCDTKYFTKYELRKIQKKFYRNFIISRVLRYILNPFLLIRKIRSMEDVRYIIRLAGASLKIFKSVLNKKTKRTGDFLYKKNGKG